MKDPVHVFCLALVAKNNPVVGIHRQKIIRRNQGRIDKDVPSRILSGSAIAIIAGFVLALFAD